MNDGIMELDIHGMTQQQAKVCIDACLRRVKRDTYRIRVIHGYRGGTALRDMIRREYGGKNARVRRLEVGLNPGETDLVLRELF